MTIDEIVTLIQAVSDNGLTSFVYEEGDQKLVLKKKKKKNVAQAPVAPVVISQPAAPMMGTMPMQMAAAPAAVSETPEKAAEEKKESTLDIGSDKVVTSPLVGTFYSSASPEAEAFVKEGDTKLEPMKPAPPVTMIVMVCSSFLFTSCRCRAACRCICRPEHLLSSGRTGSSLTPHRSPEPAPS